ncbi:MAG: anthranilate synthase component I family protein, partial [Flavobacteriaceae bacterium]|nr:anthranilate synthase component I family protein [Muriicola sp.]NNL39649.1 anthranilate synthase component I family protein [Flavobacteriaceae bacterium]
MPYQLKTHYKKILADTITPVSVYLKIRDQFPNSILLESSDYRANDNTFSYICCNPIASITVEDEKIREKFPDGTFRESDITGTTEVAGAIDNFAKQFQVSEQGFKFINNGLFGYLAYDAVRYF